jgi:hypothetical protein
VHSCSITVGLFGFTAGWDLRAVLAAVAEIGAIVLLGSWWVITTRKRGAPRWESATKAQSLASTLSPRFKKVARTKRS